MRLVQFLDFQLMKEDQILTFYFLKVVKDFFVVGGVEMSMNYVSNFNCRNSLDLWQFIYFDFSCIKRE